MGITDEAQLMGIKAGAVLHDIGKIAIPEYILNKPTVLTETEFEKMKFHPVVGAHMLRGINFPYPVLPLVKSHHERWDGNGYPDGLKGLETPIGARILAIVDCYDALTTNRPYRSPMARPQVVEFFEREAGKAYDPEITRTFINNLEVLEQAGSSVSVPESDLWGNRDVGTKAQTNVRRLERVQPTVTYGKALNADADIQRDLYSIFEFSRAEIRCLTRMDILTFMGSKLQRLVNFDSAVFYNADLVEGLVRAEHVIGTEIEELSRVSLTLEQKLTGWAAANNQALCNLPPFPDFLRCEGERPNFDLSAIAPLNRNGVVLGAISLYRKGNIKFTEEEFRRLEIVASQTAAAFAKCIRNEESSPLFDIQTGLPNGFQLYLMFDQVAMDASRYDYPISLIVIALDDVKEIRRRWGYMSGDEAIKSASAYLLRELRESDLLVRYASEEFVAVNPKMSRDQAEALKSRLQNELDHFEFSVRSDSKISIPVSVGIAVFPEDGTQLEDLISAAQWRAREDLKLRGAVRRRVSNFPVQV
jgi:diguanylate cyclase (GGDEF)-like protein/putative nucleotidyltransferase with HDIG domain